MLEQNSFVIMRTWIAIAAMLLVGIALAPSRASAQAADGPQAGATPSDQPASQQAPRAIPQIGGHPSLAGNWTLNKDQSDDPRQKMQAARGNSGGGQGGGGGNGGGRRGGGGRGQGDMAADFSKLTIEQTATSAKVSGSSGRVLALCSTDKSSPSANSSASNDAGNSGDYGEGGNQGPVPAQWQGNQLVATTQGRRGGSTTRTYELSPDGTQLYVTTKMDNPRLQHPVTYRFVYDAANANGGGSQ
jgi:hypothetical protein